MYIIRMHRNIMQATLVMIRFIAATLKSKKLIKSILITFNFLKIKLKYFIDPNLLKYYALNI